MKVVPDTNVLISAIFFSGPPSRILSAWIDDQFELVVSTEILEEYREVAIRIGEKFPDVELGLAFPRFRGHYLKGGYDVPIAEIEHRQTDPRESFTS